MDFLSEVLVISAIGNQANTSIYDTKNGAVLASYKGGTSVRNGLGFIFDDYLISAMKDSSQIAIWRLTKNGEIKHMVVPGKVNCFAVTNCGSYCIAGIDKSIYIWEIATGVLLSSLQYHSQEITCMRITCDGSHFISGGKDGIVLVWLLAHAVADSEFSNHIKPRFTWHDHSSEVTDIHVGSLGTYSRVVTSSKDMSCRLYELQSGVLLTTIRFDFSITAVTMDESEDFLFIGASTGEIFRLNIFAETEYDVHYNKSDLKCPLLGHTQTITCLSISTSGKYLVSGSEDCDCRLWDLTNFAIVRRISHKGPVTNAFITLKPPGLICEKTFTPRTVFQLFQKEYDNSQDALSDVKTTIMKRDISLFHVGTPDNFFDGQSLHDPENAVDETCSSMGSMHIANSQMFTYALSEGYDILLASKSGIKNE